LAGLAFPGTETLIMLNDEVVFHAGLFPPEMEVRAPFFRNSGLATAASGA
jgi:hypothetical protein